MNNTAFINNIAFTVILGKIRTSLFYFMMYILILSYPGEFFDLFSLISNYLHEKFNFSLEKYWFNSTSGYYALLMFPIMKIFLELLVLFGIVKRISYMLMPWIIAKSFAIVFLFASTLIIFINIFTGSFIILPLMMLMMLVTFYAMIELKQVENCYKNLDRVSKIDQKLLF